MAVPFVYDPLAQALTRMQNLLAAEQAITGNGATGVTGQQSYSAAGRSAVRAQLAEIHKEIARLEKRIAQLQARAARGGMRVRGAVPL